jgi:hypothetical protein
LPRLPVEEIDLDVSGTLVPAERRIYTNAAEPLARRRFTLAHEPRRRSVVGTGAELADGWIVPTAEEFAAARRRYWLVTSDRALRAAAAATAERTIGGGSFARELRGR